MYTKTQWVDNTTPIDKNNLNKIEQGIYDNSLVVDAVTNTLNPTDTETYKTAELTEGQITDVIGVNDIVIKGQTEQDGTPTPSAPIDVNVVSGSNVINTSNKNLLSINNGTFTSVYNFNGNVQNGIITVNGTPSSTPGLLRITLSQPIKLKQNDSVKINVNNSNGIGTSSNYVSFRLSGIVNGVSNDNITEARCNNANANGTFTATNDTIINQIVIRGNSNVTFNNFIIKPQIELGTTATTYEPHQGKELPLDLPVENLFDKDNVNQGDWNNPSLSTALTLYIGKVIKGDKYTISNYNGYRYAMIVSDTSTQSSIANALQSSGTQSGNTFTFTANFEANNGYLFFKITKSNGSNITPSEINANDFQIEQGSKANAYTPYGTDSIELCKIGNYQDYFYKFENDWYLHKEINKITSYNGETISTSYVSTTGELSTGAKVYYVVNSTNTKITDTTLTSQLEAIYNAPLYEQTNITQTNNDLPMVLDITACKDNINGIKAFIRK